MNETVENGLLDGAIAPAINTRLFGHEEAQSFLASSYGRGKGHHAVLIEGPEGIGKATLAFRFAHHVLRHPQRENAPDRLEDPDPMAPEFRQIAAGASHNLLHLARPFDAKTGKQKSGITVDEVRRVGKFFGQTSGSDSWRIVVVDTADELNRNAANAILKLLEEPPKRSMFLVLSHAPGKLLPTIRSRCLPLVLRPLGEGDLVAALAHLGIEPPANIRDRVMALSGGSVAQAIKLINYGGLEIIDAFDAVLGSDGAARRRSMHQLADVVARKDSDTLFGFFVDHLTEHVAGMARMSGLSGEVERAYGLSRLHSALGERFQIAAAYNLDRKQTVLTVLGELSEQL